LTIDNLFVGLRPEAPNSQPGYPQGWRASLLSNPRIGRFGIDLSAIGRAGVGNPELGEATFD